jgi:hypothetical protein
LENAVLCGIGFLGGRDEFEKIEKRLGKHRQR